MEHSAGLKKLYRDKSSLIASRITSARKAKKLTQQQVSELSKNYNEFITTSRLQMWEIARRTPKIEIFEQLADMLGTTPSYLMGFTDVQSKDSDAWRYVIPNGDRLNDKDISLDFLAIHVDQLRDKGFNERDILAIKVRDHTVTPFIPDDVVFVDTSRKTITEPVLCAIRSSTNHVWLRNIKPEMHGSFTMYCTDKRNYPDETLSPEQLDALDIIGQYVGHFHWQN